MTRAIKTMSLIMLEHVLYIRLVPYYAWGNRGDSEMTVWMPLR